MSRQAFTTINEPEVRNLPVNYPTDFATVRTRNFFQCKIPSKGKYESSYCHGSATLEWRSFKLALLPTDIEAFTRFFIWFTHNEQLLRQLLESACPYCPEKSHRYISAQKIALSLKQFMIAFAYQLAPCHRHSLKQWLHPV